MHDVMCSPRSPIWYARYRMPFDGEYLCCFQLLYRSHCVCGAASTEGASDDEIRQKFFRKLLMFPLAIQVSFDANSLSWLIHEHTIAFAQNIRTEIANNMWVRNGHTLHYQSILYAQSGYCNASIDLDIFLIQASMILAFSSQ